MKRLAGHRVFEIEAVGVQGNTFDQIGFRSVSFVTDNRVADVSQLHADLMFPTCLNPDAKQRFVFAAF